MSISTGNLACPSIAVSICPLHPAGRRPNTRLLSAPFVRTSFGARSFSVAAPKIWNSLPPSLRTCTSPDTFRRHLKTHYCQPQCRLLLTIVCVYKLYLLTYFCAPLLHHEPPVHTPDNTLICSSVFAGLTLVTNRQTDTRDGPRYVCSNRPHVTPCVATRLHKRKTRDAMIRLAATTASTALF